MNHLVKLAPFQCQYGSIASVVLLTVLLILLIGIPALGQTITVDVSLGYVLNSFRPPYALGAGVPEQRTETMHGSSAQIKNRQWCAGK